MTVPLTPARHTCALPASPPDELEVLARGAVSHREKCALLLGSALNSRLALEQVADSASDLDPAAALQLRRVCASLLAALRVSETRVRVYGRCAASVAPLWRSRPQPHTASPHAPPAVWPDTRSLLPTISYTFFQKLANAGCRRGTEAKFDEVPPSVLCSASVHLPDTHTRLARQTRSWMC